MIKNIGPVDGVVRILVAIIFAGLFFTNQVSGIVAVILLILAGIFMLTSLSRFCPVYYLMSGLSAVKKGS